jgi:large subunit ribosomal protein L4
MTAVKIYNQTGQEVGQTELDQAVFGLKPKAGLIEQAIITLLANRRPTIAHTKTRGEVRGGGKKPWKQKGTGRARQGSIRSPQWKGGGVIFGPRKNRVYTRKMNVSAKRLAMLMSLSDKAKNDKVVLVDKIDMAKPKTKEFVAMIKALKLNRKVLVILSSTDANVIKSGRNLQQIKFIRADSLNTYDIVNHNALLIVQSALPIITKTFVK